MISTNQSVRNLFLKTTSPLTSLTMFSTNCWCSCSKSALEISENKNQEIKAAGIQQDIWYSIVGQYIKTAPIHSSPSSFSRVLLRFNANEPVPSLTQQHRSTGTNKKVTHKGSRTLLARQLN